MAGIVLSTQWELLRGKRGYSLEREPSQLYAVVPRIFHFAQQINNCFNVHRIHIYILYIVVVSCWYTCNSYVLSMVLADSDLVGSDVFVLQSLVASLSMRRLSQLYRV